MDQLLAIILMEPIPLEFALCLALDESLQLCNIFLHQIRDHPVGLKHFLNPPLVHHTPFPLPESHLSICVHVLSFIFSRLHPEQDHTGQSSANLTSLAYIAQLRSCMQ